MEMMRKILVAILAKLTKPTEQTMPRGIRGTLTFFLVACGSLWLSMTVLVTRASPEIELVMMGCFLLGMIAWGLLLITLFFPAARPWRLKLGALVLLSPLLIPIAMGVGHGLRPVVFLACRPAYENAVAQLLADPKGAAKNERVRLLPETGTPQQIAFCVGGGFPGYSQWYIWRADDRKPEGIFVGAISYAPHWFETALN